jgi:SAM-dependent methyltransferase
MNGRLRLPQLSTGTQPALREGWRAGVFCAFWGVPSGRLGWVGARVLPFVAGRFYGVAADALALHPDDDLLDVGCGAGVLLSDHAEGLRFAAGIDASEIQVGLARDRLAGRIAAGTAEIVLGDAAALPWPDGRFSAVASVNCLKFVADPDRALREMHRVLRPGGRVVHLTEPPITDPEQSGKVDAFGIRQWSAVDSRRMMERAGFTEVSVRQLPATYLKLQLVRGIRPT